MQLPDVTAILLDRAGPADHRSRAVERDPAEPPGSEGLLNLVEGGFQGWPDMRRAFLEPFDEQQGSLPNGLVIFGAEGRDTHGASVSSRILTPGLRARTECDWGRRRFT